MMEEKQNNETMVKCELWVMLDVPHDNTVCRFFNIIFNEEKFSLNHPNFFVYSHDFEYSEYFCLYEK